MRSAVVKFKVQPSHTIPAIERGLWYLMLSYTLVHFSIYLALCIYLLRCLQNAWIHTDRAYQLGHSGRYWFQTQPESKYPHSRVLGQLRAMSLQPHRITMVFDYGQHDLLVDQLSYAQWRRLRFYLLHH